MFDITLECIRAVILLYLLVHLVIATRNQTENAKKAWYYVLAGFSLLFFANLLDITDNIDSLSRFVIIGDTPTQAILEKIVGYSLGFLLVTIGMMKWLPAMTTKSKLQTSERKFRLAFETSGIGMVIAAKDGKFLKVNKTLCGMTGYTETELIEMDTLKLTHPDDIKASNQVIENLITGKKTHDTIEKRYIHKDGSTIWAMVSISIVTDENGKIMHFISQINDITSRKKAELKVDQQREYLMTVFETAPTGILLIDDQKIINHINDVAASLVGKQFSEIVGKKPGDCIGCVHSFEAPKGCGNSTSCLKCELNNIINSTLDSGKPTLGKEIESTIYLNGQPVKLWLKISSNIVNIEGKRNVILAIDDITKSKKIHKQLTKEKERADNMVQKADKANKTKSQFLASMSHEIRTPMNSIIGFSDILAEEITSPEHKEYLKIIQNSGNHLLQLINDILDYSKIEAGKMDIDISFCSLQDIFNKVESMMQPFAINKNLVFEFNKNPNIPEKIRTDPARVEQCLINLINNAIKFTDKGHVKVNTSIETIDNKEFVCIDVEDTGIGISPEVQQEIFNSFTQAEQGTAKKQAGTGLGLAITKQLTGLLGGSIRLASTPSKGSTFTMLIPMGLIRKSDKEMNGTESQETDKRKFSASCLVAESNTTNQQLMKILLEKMGLSVTLADSTDDAINKSAQQQFDLIFIDIPLPGTTQIDTPEKIRENAPDTPIIALTANQSQLNENPACDHYLQKPITLQAFEEIAKKYIGRKQPA